MVTSCGSQRGDCGDSDTIGVCPSSAVLSTLTDAADQEGPRVGPIPHLLEQAGVSHGKSDRQVAVSSRGP